MEARLQLNRFLPLAGIEPGITGPADQDLTNRAIRPQGYKTFFVLSLVEHKILNAHKDKNIKKFSFSDSDKRRMLFFLLINVKMPSCWHFNIYEQEKFHAQLS